jgi:DNA repair photolyase
VRQVRSTSTAVAARREAPAPAHRSPDLRTINVHRGCTHACTYCFARPSHTYLGLDAGGDFESVIVVKVNAVDRPEQLSIL